jgi:glycosyltransferase involved in cell wall biosynthesis
MNDRTELAGSRVLFFLPGLELGGAERQALHLARHLKGMGCDVRVWGNSGPGLAADQCEEAGIPWGVQSSCWPCRKLHLPRFVWRVLKTVWVLRRERPDVILAYCPRPCTSSGLAWRWSRAKICVWGQRDSNDLRGDAVERLALHWSSAVICNAAHEVEYLRNTFGEVPLPIHVVHNGLDMAPPRKARAQWRAELGIDAETTVAIMVSNFRWQKDHSTLLHAWTRIMKTIPGSHPRALLLLAGAYQESYAAVHGLASDLGLLDSIKFLGQVKDVAGLLGASDIGILATTHEGLPNAILEYMVCGLPVVTTDIPGNREALGDDTDDQLCPAGDAESLAERLLTLIQSPDLRRRLGQRNRQRAVAEFSITKMCETMAGIVCDLLNTVPAR